MFLRTCEVLRQFLRIIVINSKRADLGRLGTGGGGTSGPMSVDHGIGAEFRLPAPRLGLQCTATCTATVVQSMRKVFV